MNNMEIEDLIPELLKQKRSGKSNGDIRNELREGGFSDDDVRTILRHVDTEYLNELQATSGRNKKDLFRIFGLAVIAGGLIIDIILWSKGAKMGYFLATNAVSILGIVLIWRQYRLFKKLNSN